MTVKNFVEVSLKTTVDSGELLAMLQDGGALGSWEEEGMLHIYWSEEQWQLSVLEDLECALARLGVEIGDVGLTVNPIPDRDWNAAWVATLRPIQIGRRVRIRQSWHAPDPAFTGIDLIVDLKRAFGSGYHATTQLVIEWLEDHIKDGDRVLDIGTGSGILAMTAIRLGAGFALGIDNDPAAIECARELSDLNGFGRELELRTASFDQVTPGDFDMVLANLDGKTLPLLCPFLPAFLRAEGLACLSGLQHQDLEQIANALRKAGLGINSRTGREDWLSLEVQRKG